MPTQSSGGTEAPRPTPMGAEGDPGIEDLSLGAQPTMSVGHVHVTIADAALSYTAGTLLGRYIVLDEIGRGGMGVVFRAYDPDLDRPVALKLMRAAVAGRGRSSEAERLFREAQALARLAHPNVVAVHDVGTVDEAVFVAMELVEGATLRKWLAAKTDRPWRENLQPLLAAGEGLAAAHAAGIVHRDFKPDNVIVGTDGRVRVLDFGLARSTHEGSRSGAAALSRRPPLDLGASSTGLPPVAATSAPNGAPSIAAPASSGSLPPSSDNPRASESGHATLASPSSSARSSRSLETPLTRKGAVMGTPAYMAPEQHRGEPADARCDQFAFCVSLHEALFGFRPKLGNHRRNNAGPVPDAKVEAPAGTKVPLRVRRAIQRGLATAPENRFPTMAALLAELRRDPWATPRRWAPLGAAAIVTVLGVWGSRKVMARDAFVCQGSESHLVGVWDGARRSALQDAFAKTGATFARDTARTVTTTLDAYANAWATSHRETCEATRLRREQAEATMELRMTCLDRRKDELSARVDALLGADAKTVEKAAVAVGALPSLSSCADTESLRNATPMPTEPSAKAAVEESLHALDQARARAGTGHGRDVLAQTEAVLATARKVGFRPLEADALHVLANLQQDSGDYETAAVNFEGAARAAYASRRDDIVALAWTDLVFLRGERQSKFDEAHRAGLDAESALERLHDDGSLRGQLTANESKLAFCEGKYEEALALAKTSLAQSERALGPNSTIVGYALLDIGNALANRGDVEGALSAYERSERVMIDNLGVDHPSVASVRNNLGNIAHLRGDGEAALRYFSQAGETWAKSRGPFHQDVATAHLNRGGAFQDMGRYDEALAELEKARAIYVVAVGPAHPDVALVNLNIGQTLGSLNRHEEAVPYLQRADAIFGKLGHPHASYALVGLGNAYRAKSKFDLALKAYDKALAVREKAVGAEHPEVADILRLVAEARLAAGGGVETVPLFAKAYALLCAAKDVDPAMRARAAFAYGRALWQLGVDRSRARELVGEARVGFVQAGEGSTRSIAELDAWMTKHRI